jgi:hypothetical protein
VRNALVGLAIAGYLAQAQKQLSRPGLRLTTGDVLCEAEWLAYNAASGDNYLPVAHYAWTILSEQWQIWPGSYIGMGLDGQPCKGCEGSRLRPLDHTPACRETAK